MDVAKIQLSSEQQTLLATLYARARESSSPDPILHDEMAEEAVRRIDYDFNRLKVDTLSIAMRAKLFDNWTSDYLEANPNAIVIQLGCGLDSRVFRLDPPSTVTWLDVDFPAVVELRKNLYPGRSGYEMIASPLEDLTWVESLSVGRPAWVLLEGVSMYLSEHTMGEVLATVTGHFATGAIAFDALGPAATRMAGGNRSVRATGAKFGGFSVDEPGDLKRFAPKLELVTIAHTPEMPGYAKLPLHMRMAVRVVDSVASLRKLSRIFLYRF